MEKKVSALEDEIRSYLEFAEKAFVWDAGMAKREEPGGRVRIKNGLESIREEIGDCRRCKLHEGRKNIVFGSGNPDAELVFAGEGPGEDEDIQGLPFVGRAGSLLTEIIKAMKLDRKNVYICNVVKCRPPGNRIPQRDEINVCSSFLFKQLETIKPRVIVALGAVSTHTILDTKESIFKLRGRFYIYNGMKVMPTFHPAFLLRSPLHKKDVWQDMKTVMKELEIL
ncbi:MAG TPA: uracil-DNA glycosylase [bacterium]